ncbi:MAG TPA: histidine phosphatase family protein [Candidatus Dormibacteraeota bacterium]
MPVLLVRHAEAGEREAWEGDDRLRPLTGKGRRQAAAIADQLRAHEPRRILSSPYLRCVQTVEPLAAALGLEVEETDELAEGAGPALVLRALDGEGAIALSTHGDNCDDVLKIVREQGLAGAKAEAKKASTWVLEGSGGRITGARYLPPPA